MRRIVLLAVAAAVAGGCGAPSEPAKQAEELHSIAAEAALLARDVADDRTTSAFARVHAEALRATLRQLEPKVRSPILEPLVDEIAEPLDELASAPGDRVAAAFQQKRLEAAAAKAGEAGG